MGRAFPHARDSREPGSGARPLHRKIQITPTAIADGGVVMGTVVTGALNRGIEALLPIPEVGDNDRAASLALNLRNVGK
jgi:hypothetical protein